MKESTRVAMIALALAAVVAVSCSKDNATSGTAGAGDVPTCTADDDCDVVCDMPNDCCGELCECTRVYHKSVIARIRENNDQRCTTDDRERCPQAKCAKPDNGTVAVCNQGTCEAKLVPWGSEN